MCRFVRVAVEGGAKWERGWKRMTSRGGNRRERPVGVGIGGGDKWGVGMGEGDKLGWEWERVTSGGWGWVRVTSGDGGGRG